MKIKFDEFGKLNLNDMSKSISEMTYQYVPKETGKPTEVPASHYKKILSTTIEETVADAVKLQFLGVMFNQLKVLRDEDPILFQKGLIMLDLGIKPKEIGVKEQIALSLFGEQYQTIAADYKKSKKDLYMSNEQFVNIFKDLLENKNLQGAIIGEAKTEPTESTEIQELKA